MPDLKHAELIDGQVYMPSPVSTSQGDIHQQVSVWLAFYAAFTPGTRGGSEGTWLMQRDAPQPDSIQTLQQGLASPEHAAFIEGLKSPSAR